MIDIYKEIKIQEKAIRTAIEQLESSLSQAPEGTLLICRRPGYCEYYQRLPTVRGKKERRKYISKKNPDLAEALAQKDYDIKALLVLKKAMPAIAALTTAYPEKALADIYENLDPERRKLVIPLVLPDREFIQKWLNSPYEGGSFRPDDKSRYYTERGERVRSKSELIIANVLYHAGIPYKYEFPHTIGGKTFHPDFTILDIHTRREIILEHFGMLDDPEYLKTFQRKIDFYIMNGIIPGRDFIFTLESSSFPLDTRVVMKLIEEQLQ